jgi:hypothetical protein
MNEPDTNGPGGTPDDDTESVEKLRERLFKERRLLLGVSVFLLAHLWLGLRVDQSNQSLGFLGLRFVAANPDALWWVAWTIWLWSFLSYLQLFNSMRAMRFYPSDRMLETYHYLAGRAAMNHVWRIVRRRYHSIPRALRRGISRRYVGIQFDEDIGPYEEAATPYFNAIFATTWKNITGKTELEDIPDIPKKDDSEYTWYGGRQHLKRREDGHIEVRDIINTSISYDFRGARLAAHVWTTVSTSFGLDYLLPLAIAAAPLVVSLWTWCVPILLHLARTI